MSKLLLMMAWATNDEARPIELAVFDHFVDTSLRESGLSVDVEAVFGNAVYKDDMGLAEKLRLPNGPRFLVVSLDATKIWGDDGVLYSNDLQEIVKSVDASAGVKPANPVLEFESRANRVARGYLVPLTHIPDSVSRFVKSFKTGFNADVMIETEKDLRGAFEEGFPLPDLERTALFERLFADLPHDFEGRAAALTEINDAFRQELAVRLTPALNAHLNEAAPEDAEAKKRLANDVMEKLDGMNLAVRSPSEGAASILNVWIDNRHPLGRFAIQPKGEKRPTITRANVADLLPLELTDARPRREALREWRQSRASEPKKK